MWLNHNISNICNACIVQSPHSTHEGEAIIAISKIHNIQSILISLWTKQEQHHQSQSPRTPGKIYELAPIVIGQRQKKKEAKQDDGAK